MAAQYSLQGVLGWLPDFPDFRDRTPNHRSNPDRAYGDRDCGPAATAVDLSPWCSPVENQGALGRAPRTRPWDCTNTSTSRATVSTSTRLVRLQDFAQSPALDGRQAAHSSAREWARSCCSGFRPRSTGRTTSRGRHRTPAFCYAFGENFKAVQYVRLDRSRDDPAGVITR